MISAQKGVEFQKSDYGKIKKVYSIWICMNVPDNVKNTITKYSIKEENIIGKVRRKKESYDLMAIIIIGLGEEKEENFTGVIKLLSVLLSDTTMPAEKKRILKDEFEISMTKNMESEVNDMCNLSDGIEERAEKRERIKLLKNLITSTGWDIQKAMEMLGMDAEEQEKYKRLLSEMK